jgi:glutamate racemase
LLQKGIDTLVLGCTHYPFLAPAISEIAGDNVMLVDPALETVEELYKVLEEKGILNDNQVNSSREFYVSGNDESFYRVGRMLLGDVIKKVERINLD